MLNGMVALIKVLRHCVRPRDDVAWMLVVLDKFVAFYAAQPSSLHLLVLHCLVQEHRVLRL
jgi:hypothetical protein